MKFLYWNSHTPASFSEISSHHPHGTRWHLVRATLITSQLLAWLTLLFALLVLLGYLLSTPSIYRPIGLSATHPLTALCFALLSICVLLHYHKKLFSLSLASLVCLLCISKFWVGEFDSPLIPFNQIVLDERMLGLNNQMGINTAIMFFLCAISLIAKILYYPKLSQLFSSLAVLFPSIAFIGYAYTITDFYGQMSLTTTLAGFIICYAILASTAHRGAVRAILSPFIGGYIARYQVALGFIFPFAVGFLLISTIRHTSVEGSMAGILVVFTIWFITLLVCSSALFQEHVDGKRRKLEKQLFHSATQDSLTQIANRRKLLQFGESECERSSRSDMEVWCLLVDIDNFKRINDAAGHPTGDIVIRQVAKTLEENIRKVDMVGRIGGEEFAVVLFNSDQQSAELVAEKLRQAVYETQIVGWTHSRGPISVSIGIANNAGNPPFEVILSNADKALYAAKLNGRNQVVNFQDMPTDKSRLSG